MKLLILILIAFMSPAAQQSVDTEKLKSQSQELSDATLSGNYTRAADLTFPKLVRLMGGRTQYIATLKKMATEMHSGPYRIISVTAGEPQDIIEVNHQHYAIVPTTTRIKVPEGILVGEGFMIGISQDGGQNWTFVDAGGNAMDKQKLTTLFGAAANQLRIPPEKRPVLYRGVIQ